MQNSNLNGNILVVDDAPENLRLLVGVLNEKGYETRPVPNGKLALLAAKLNPPDLILLDILMPDMDGYEVCTQLKADEKTKSIPVIFLSAVHEVLDKVKAFAVGGVDYITKPFQIEEVLARVETHITLVSVQKSLAAKNEELAANNAELNSTLQQLKITQKELIQSAKMVSLGQLIAGISHEINNPINFIYGNLSHADSYARELIYIIESYQQEYPNKTEKIKKILEEIDLEFIKEDFPKLYHSMQVGSDRIRKIILSLRKFSRLDESRMKAVDLHEGIESTLLILGHRFQADDRKIKIEVKPEYAQLPFVTCNASHINQVFLNIIGNAIDALADYRQFTSHSHKDRVPTIWIRTEVSDNETVKIQISDNGSGMSQEIRQHIFNPFFTTKPVGSGAGLGLAISYSIIVEEHGGKLDCHSRSGIGTQFSIELPIRGKIGNQ
jgi:signal transduction histidine kinase